MYTIVRISFCFLLVCLACKPDRTTTEGWTPVRKDTLNNLTAHTSDPEDVQTLLQGYGFDDADGRFLHYKKQTDSTAFLVWGDDSFQRVVPDTLWENQTNYWPSVDIVTSNYIALNYGCGSPCWGKIVLPFDKDRRIGYYMFDYFFDVANNLIGYYDYKVDKNMFVVENIITGKQQIIALQPACESAFGGYCIDSVRFTNRQLTIVWKTPDAFTDSVKLQKTFRKRISI